MTRSARRGLIFLAFTIGVSVLTVAVPKTQGWNLAQHGMSLRKEINAAYADAKAKHALSQGGYDVTAIVLKYIPAGITFNEAEQILRAAGCVVSAHSLDSTKGGDSTAERIRLSSVVGSLGMSKGFWDMGNSLIVTLSPGQPGEYDFVAKINASIVHQVS